MSTRTLDRTRVGDTDRERTVQALEHYASAGYLTLDEFSERSATAYRATTRGELARLTEDLTPAATSAASVARRASGPHSWSPALTVAAVIATGVLLVAVLMAVLMLGMMDGMHMGGMR